MSTIAAIIVARQNKYIRTFRQAGAVSAASSIHLSECSLRKSMIFDRLVRQGILVPAGNDRYYLDEAKEKETRRKRLPVVIIAMIILLIALLIIFNNK